MDNYGRKPTFSSFLPGISGLKGIPAWCFYVNRGQAVTSFGVEDKDHAIMEFYPAHQAYRNVKTVGFRTFLRLDGRYLEPFGDARTPHGMTVERNILRLWEQNDAGIRTEITYFTLPLERIGGLVRRVRIVNCAEQTVELEVLDGMPEVVPCGVGMRALKEMGQTAQAWMQAEYVESRVPYFKARAGLDGAAVVTAVKGGNFSLAMDETGELLRPVVDPDAVFAWDSSLQDAVNFRERGLQGVYGAGQALSNRYPCSFCGAARTLKPGESLTLWELMGQAPGRDVLTRFLERKPTPAYFEEKEAQAAALTEELCGVISTRTGDPDFDEYCARTYMDNVLRGGFPVVLPGGRIFHVYSRRQGDPERDYNDFRMLPEYYSQGSGNFRDVNRSRCMDSFFTPYAGRENIKTFYGLIQLDGYNPLSVEQVTCTLDEEAVEEIFDPLNQEQREELMTFLTDAFTPGGFYRKLEELGVREEDRQDAFFAQVMERAGQNRNAEFGEGCRFDPWTCNLDLIESYLSVYPEREAELLMEQDYTYFCAQAPIPPRSRRYVKTENGVRQYRFPDGELRRTDGEKLVRARYGQGEPVRVTLLEKLLVLCAAGYAALDAYGMGVETEGGRPGWYGALPGLFGSSVAETCELARLLEYTLRALDKCPAKVRLTREVAEYLQVMDAVTLLHRDEIACGEELLEFWNRRGEARESYTEKTFHGISGEKTELGRERLREILGHLLETVRCGIRKAVRLCGGTAPACFAYEMECYTETRDGIRPEHFAWIRLPDSLEGPVHLMRLEEAPLEKRELYAGVKAGALYDADLGMYRMNASPEDASPEPGRAKAFPPGWPENESVWLHMEYQYLLELLKGGLYHEYLEDFQRAAVPFLDPDRYGRSIYENVSFIASSRNPNESDRGRGFVARLDGSTAEFLQMWKLMMFGKDNFRVRDGGLSLTFAPVLPAALVGEEKTVEAMFLGRTAVTYHFAQCRDYVPGEYRVTQMKLTYGDGSAYQTVQPVIGNLAACDVRDGRVERIDIWIN